MKKFIKERYLTIVTSKYKGRNITLYEYHCFRIYKKYIEEKFKIHKNTEDILKKVI